MILGAVNLSFSDRMKRLLSSLMSCAFFKNNQDEGVFDRPDPDGDVTGIQHKHRLRKNVHNWSNNNLRLEDVKKFSSLGTFLANPINNSKQQKSSS